MAVKISTDTRDFDKGIRGIEKRAGRLGRVLDTAVGTALGFGAATLAIAGVGRAFDAAGGAVFGMNAQLETSQLQFATLMGDAQAAEKHVRDLFDFAKATPFEVSGIVEASRFLQVFGGEALNSRENLTLLGDAAAAVSAPFQDVAFWTGRLRSQIEAGRPFGEAAMRLQELAVISPQARNAMEALSKAGADANEIWNIFAQDLQRFTGAMERQQTTWQGLTSTFMDSVQLLTATGFKPLFDFVRRGLLTINNLMGGPGSEAASERFAGILQGLLDRIRQTVGGWVQRLSEMELSTARSLGRIAGFMVGFGKTVVQWGAQIVGALAEGILGAISVVVKALDTLGQIFGFWLAPGSPPRLLPELDTWGRAAAESWLGGWTEADFDILHDVGQSAERILRGMGLEDEGLIERVAGTRSAVAGAIDHFKRTGMIGEDAMEAIRQAAGGAGSEIAELTRRSLELSQAQGKVAEISERIAGLQVRRQEIQDQMRLAQIQRKLEQGGLSAAERQLLMLEAQELELNKQLRVAQKNVGERQNQLAIFEARLGVQQESLSLTERLRDALEGAAGSAGKIKGALEGLADLTMKPLGELDIGDPLESFNLGLERFDTLIAEFKTGFGEGETAAETFSANIEGFMGGLAEKLGLVNAETDKLGGTIDELGKTWDSAAKKGGPLVDLLIGIGTAFATFKILSSISGLVGLLGALASAVTGAGGVSAILGGLVALLGGPLTLAIGAVSLAVGLLAIAWRRDWGGIREKTKTIWERYLKPILGDLKSALGDLPIAIQAVKDLWFDFWDAFKAITLPGWLDRLIDKLGSIIDRAREAGTEMVEAGFLGASPPKLETGLKAVNRQFDRTRQRVGRLARSGLARQPAGLDADAWKNLAAEVANAQEASESFTRFWTRDLLQGMEDVERFIIFDLIDAIDRLGNKLSDVARSIRFDFLPLGSEVGSIAGQITTSIGGLTSAIGAVESQLWTLLDISNVVTTTIMGQLSNLQLRIETLGQRLFDLLESPPAATTAGVIPIPIINIPREARPTGVTVQQIGPFYVNDQLDVELVARQVSRRIQESG